MAQDVAKSHKGQQYHASRRAKGQGEGEKGKRFKWYYRRAVCETTKYTVKNEDYILSNNWQLTLESVATLDKALANRRLVAFGGVMKEWHKKLNLDDEIDGKLIEEGEDINRELIKE